MTATGNLNNFPITESVVQLEYHDLTGAGKAETYDEACQSGDKHSATLDPDDSVCPAPDSQTSTETKQEE